MSQAQHVGDAAQPHEPWVACPVGEQQAPAQQMEKADRAEEPRQAPELSAVKGLGEQHPHGGH